MQTLWHRNQTKCNKNWTKQAQKGRNRRNISHHAIVEFEEEEEEVASSSAPWWLVNKMKTAAILKAHATYNKTKNKTTKLHCYTGASTNTGERGRGGGGGMRKKVDRRGISGIGGWTLGGQLIKKLLFRAYLVWFCAMEIYAPEVCIYLSVSTLSLGLGIVLNSEGEGWGGFSSFGINYWTFHKHAL